MNKIAKYIKKQDKFQMTVFVLGLVLVGYAFIYSGSINPKITERDRDQALAFFKFNILTHDGMNLGETTPTFSGKNENWSMAVDTQMKRFLWGNPFVHKLPSVPYVFAYRLEYQNGNYAWVVWYDDGTTEPRVGDDVTVVIPVDDPMVDMLLSERFLLASETEPLIRGYLVEGGVAKILITKDPVFVYPQP